jgi:hypothetical protein
VRAEANGKAQGCDPVKACKRPLAQRLIVKNEWKAEEYSGSGCVSATDVQSDKAEWGRREG